jgi:hypothetical protein
LIGLGQLDTRRCSRKRAHPNAIYLCIRGVTQRKILRSTSLNAKKGQSLKEKSNVMQRRTLTTTTLLLAAGVLAISPLARGVTPPPDGGYAGGNTAEGEKALLGLTTGTYNTAVGFFGLQSNQTGNFNTALGAGALLANTGDENTATGAGGLLSNTTGFDNTANGTFALIHNDSGSGNTAVGRDALFANTSGSNNTAVGRSALSNNTGNNNTEDGVSALVNNTTGQSNTAIGTGSLLGNTTGNSNTTDGVSTLANNTTGQLNTAIGIGALVNNTTGSNNIALGANAGSNVFSASDTICIGIAGVDVTDGCYIDHVFEEPLAPDNLTMAIDVHGKVGTLPSSRRFKDDIKAMDKTSEVILALKPVTFHYRGDSKRRPQFGLIAEEVAEVDRNLVALHKEGKPFSVRYNQVNAMLLNEFLKEHKKVETHQARIENQEETIARLKAGSEEQQATIASLKFIVEQQEKNM